MKYAIILVICLSQAIFSVAYPVCTGTPVGGNIIANKSTTCGGDTLLLTDMGCSVGTDISYQWQYSTDNFTWNDLTGGVTNPYQFIPPGSYFYRCKVTCNPTCIFAYSNIVYINHHVNCPCIPVYHSAGCSYVMVHLKLSGEAGSNINDPAGCAVFGYIDRTNVVPPLILAAGHSYNGTAYLAHAYWFNEGQAWIDFNDDGVFDHSEAVSSVFGDPSIYLDSLHFTVNIPSGAPNGIHRMRVRHVSTFENTTLSTALSPCNLEDDDSLDIYQEGNALDYEIVISPRVMGNTHLCKGDTTTLHHPIPGGTWISSNNLFATVDSSTGLVTAVDNGTVMIYYIVGTDVFTSTVQVYPLPNLVIAPSYPTKCIDSPIQLFASGAEKFQWTPGTALSCTGFCDTCSSPFANPSSNITYEVIGSTAVGCKASAFVSVTVDSCTTKITGLREKKGLELFPNPVNNTLYITSPYPVTKITTTNIQGQVLFNSEYDKNNIRVDLSTLPSGIYFIKINDTEVRKFVKQ